VAYLTSKKITRRSFASLAIATGLAGATRPASAQQQRLRVHVFPGAYTSMTVHVADELGFFARNGLRIEKIQAQSSSAAIAAMLGGSVDVVESGCDLVLSNIDKGTNIKYVAANEVKNYVTLIVSSKVRAPSVKEGYPKVMQGLKGLRFGINAIGSTLHLAALMMLADAGMKKDDVQFVATGTAATTVAAWRAGTVDAQLALPPVPELVDALGLSRVAVAIAEDGPDILKFTGLYSGWVMRGDYIERSPQTADAYIRSIQESIEWVRAPANRGRLLELAKKYSPVSGLSQAQNAAVLARMISNYERFWGTQISPDTIDRWNDYSLRNGLIRRRVAFDRVVYAKAPRCTTSCR